MSSPRFDRAKLTSQAQGSDAESMASPGSSAVDMQQHEIEHLIELLHKLKAKGRAVPDMPSAVWEAISGLLPQPAVEILITRTGRDFLLTHRKDEHWDGWHLPGGFVGYGESLGAACNRIALRELGIEVSLKQIIDDYPWPDHPYAGALSLVCWCTASEAPTAGRFFPRIPDRMVAHHADFVRAFLARSDLPPASSENGLTNIPNPS